MATDVVSTESLISILPSKVSEDSDDAAKRAEADVVDVKKTIRKHRRARTSAGTSSSRSRKNRNGRVHFFKMVQVYEISEGRSSFRPRPFDPLKRPLKSALKTSAPSNAHEQLRHIEQRDSEQQEVLKKLQTGSWLTKYNARGKPDERLFFLSEDGSDLIWRKKRRKKCSKIALASVRSIVFGPNTLRFLQFDWENDKPWLCFSLLCDLRSVDIVCKDEEEFTTWFLGLQQFVPLSFEFQTKGTLLWTRALYKISQRAYHQKTTQMNVWLKLLQQARRGVALQALQESEEQPQPQQQEQEQLSESSTFSQNSLSSPGPIDIKSKVHSIKARYASAQEAEAASIPHLNQSARAA